MQLLLIIVYTLHFLFVHLAAAGPLLSIRFLFPGKHGDVALFDREGRWLAYYSTLAIIPAAITGILLGLVLVRQRDYSAVMTSLAGKLWWSGWELGFYVICMIAYLVWWQRGDPMRFAKRFGLLFLALLAGTNLLYHFPILFVVISQFSPGSHEHPTFISAAEFRQRMLQPEYMSRTVHFWGLRLSLRGPWSWLEPCGETVARISRLGRFFRALALARRYCSDLSSYRLESGRLYPCHRRCNRLFLEATSWELSC